MESDFRYYQRRAAAEWAAAERAVTPQARARRLHLAQTYRMKAQQCMPVENHALLV
jgi:hypothetical protein